MRSRIDALEASTGLNHEPLAIEVLPVTERGELEGTLTGYRVLHPGGEEIVMRLPEESEAALSDRAVRVAPRQQGFTPISIYQIRSAEGAGIGWWQTEDER